MWASLHSTACSDMRARPNSSVFFTALLQSCICTQPFSRLSVCRGSQTSTLQKKAPVGTHGKLNTKRDRPAPAANTTSGRRIPDSGFPFVGTGKQTSHTEYLRFIPQLSVPLVLQCVRVKSWNRNRVIRLAISIRWKTSPRDLNLTHRRIAPVSCTH
jgi:hypothetical protein